LEEGSNKFQTIESFTEAEHKQLFFLTKQGLYNFRDTYITPLLVQRAANAQGQNGANASVPHGFTQDSLAALFLLKVHHDPSFRFLGSIFGVKKTQAMNWVKHIRNYIYLNDPFLIRNRNLSNPVNLENLYEEAHQATLMDTRVVGLYSHLAQPGTRLAVLGIDSRAVKAQKSSDFHLQQRSYSTKIKDNSVQKMTISTMESKPLITFPLMVSISPAGTDESSCERLVLLEEGGALGGLVTVLQAQTPPGRPQYTVVLLGEE
jgi:hypothetical protein